MSAHPGKRISTYEEERGKPAPDLAHSWAQTRLMLQLARQKEKDFEVLPELTLDLGFPDGQHCSPGGPPTRHFEGVVTDPATGAKVDLDEVFR